MNVLIWVAVALIGGAGSVARFLFDGAISAAVGRDFPFGTMAVNISGAVLLGLLTGLALGHDEALLAGTAAVGSYTTFSTWMLETQRLTEERQYRKAVLNVVVSLVLGVAAAAAGRLIGAQLSNQDSFKLTSYFGERQRTDGGFAADALLDLYGRHQIATSILLRGAEGFGARHRLRTDRSLTLSEDLPLIAVAVDSRPRIKEVLEPTGRLLSAGLVTLERAQLLSGDVETLALRDEINEETKLTIYLGRQERVYRVPAFVAVCDLLHRRGVAGATAMLGVDGTAHGRRERASSFSRNTGTPMMVIAVGSGERIGRVLPDLGGLLCRPLLTLERVRICKRDGELLCTPSALPGTDETGMSLWHKLMVYTSEAALHDGQPIHRAIVRELRAAGIAGTTTLRGVWGFHGDHSPHGDRLLQLGRHVPAVSIVIDAPERIATAFTVIDELTREQGLVTSETVPAVRAGGRGGRLTGKVPSE